MSKVITRYLEYIDDLYQLTENYVDLSRHTARQDSRSSTRGINKKQVLKSKPCTIFHETKQCIPFTKMQIFLQRL
jgi:hypothetical protein